MSLEPPPPAARSVLRTLHDAGHAAYFVGGCVRDRLLGRPVSDWDIATDAEPEAVMALFPKAIPTGLRHGTVTVVVDHLPVEVTTFRVEAEYSDGRRPDAVFFTRELEPDLARRDFTINAIAWDPDQGEIVDPFGGRADLAARVLRAVGDPRERFAEDGLRAMRAIRFASTLDLEIDPATWQAIPATLDTFRRVSVERIQVELAKILAGPRPGWGMERLDAAGLLAEFLPEVAGLPPEVRARTWSALDRIRPAGEARRPVDPPGVPPRALMEARLAALFWPLGPGAADAALRRLRFSNAERRAVVHLLGFRDPPPASVATDADVRRFVAAVAPDAVDTLLAVGAAAADPSAWRALADRIDAADARRGPHAVRDLPLTGRDVMERLGIPPSRRVGRILEALLERVWADPALGTRERLEAILEDVAREVPDP